MTQPIFLVGGGKGGVGKSTVSMALLDFFIGGGEPPLLIETDTSAPDVWKAYGTEIEGHCVDLEQKDGWLEMLEVIGRNAATRIVINTKAANQVGLRKFGGMLLEGVRLQDRELVVLWVIDRKRDGLELLASFLDSFAADPRVVVHVARNLYWGDEAKFDMFNAADLKKNIEARGGKILNFPDVADRVAESLNKSRLPIHTAMTEFSFALRIELARWQAEYRRTFAGRSGVAMRVEVGSGDVVTPGTQDITYPARLGWPHVPGDRQPAAAAFVRSACGGRLGGDARRVLLQS